jgi:hypothetical protein
MLAPAIAVVLRKCLRVRGVVIGDAVDDTESIL